MHQNTDKIRKAAEKLAFTEDFTHRVTERAQLLAAGSSLDPADLAIRALSAFADVRDGKNLLENNAFLRAFGIRANELNRNISVYEGTRIGVFGWGLVAPRTKNIDTFRRNIRTGETWLEPMEGYGPSNFMVGNPDFDFEDYRGWFDTELGTGRYQMIDKKMTGNVKYVLGSFIQAIGQNPGILETLRELDEQVHLYIGTSLADQQMLSDTTLDYTKAQRRWNRFWSHPDRCGEFKEYLAERADGRGGAFLEPLGAPEDPAELAPGTVEFEEASAKWYAFWASRSEALKGYLAESASLHDVPIGSDVEASKKAVIRKRYIGLARLAKKYGCPKPPWDSVTANRLWNIDSIPAAQINMVTGIHGLHIGMSNACAGFSAAVHLGEQAIRENRAKAAIVGAVDPYPHPVEVGTFYDARVLSCDGKPSIPATRLKGAHISGGACIWIIGDLDYFLSLGFRPVGAEIVATALNSDAGHIITPSTETPMKCIKTALDRAGITTGDVETFDLHATATPGDFPEFRMVTDLFGNGPWLTARKGVFGHGLSVGGGWELTAQHMGMEEGEIFKTSAEPVDLHPDVEAADARMITDSEVPYEGGYAGKLSMGVGGINGAVISRGWDFEMYPFQFAAIAGIDTEEVLRMIKAGELPCGTDELGLPRIPSSALKKTAG